MKETKTLKQLKALRQRIEYVNTMSNDEKVIKESHKDMEALDEAINQTERNIPKGVIYSGDGYADGSFVYDMAECPNCGEYFEEDDNRWESKHCPNCGQALEWEVQVE